MKISEETIRPPPGAGQQRQGGGSELSRVETRGRPFTDWTLSRTEHGHSCRSAAWQGLMVATWLVSLGGAVFVNTGEPPHPRTHMWSRFHVLKRTRLSRLP